MDAGTFESLRLMHRHYLHGVEIGRRLDRPPLDIAVIIGQKGSQRRVGTVAMLHGYILQGGYVGILGLALVLGYLAGYYGLYQRHKVGRIPGAYVHHLPAEGARRLGSVAKGQLEGFLRLAALAPEVIEAAYHHHDVGLRGILGSLRRARSLGGRRIGALDELEHADYRPHGARAVEHQRLAREQAYLGVVGYKVLGSGLGLLAFAGEYENVAPAIAGIVLPQYLSCHFGEYLLLYAVGLGIDEFQADIGRSVGLLPRWCLHNVAVAVGTAKPSHAPEQAVVEPHYRPGAAVVGIVGGVCAAQRVRGGEVALAHDMAQQGAVGISEAVDCLLLVADYEAVVAFGYAVGHQGAQVVPLEVGGVLKLVDKQAVELHAEAFVYEGHLGIADYTPQEVAGVGYEYEVAVFEECLQVFFGHTYKLEQRQRVSHGGEHATARHTAAGRGGKGGSKPNGGVKLGAEAGIGLFLGFEE